MGQHRRVRVAVPHAGEAREGLCQHVVQAVAGGVDDVAGQQRAERQRVAVVVLGQQARRLVGGKHRHRRRARRQRALDRVAERIGRRGREVGLRLRGAQGRVVDDDPRAHPRRGGVDAPGVKTRATPICSVPIRSKLRNCSASTPSIEISKGRSIV